MNQAMIGRTIQGFRVQKRMSQADLAILIDISPHHMSSIETGKKGLSLAALIKIADALEVTTDSLLIGYQRNNLSSYVNDITALLENCSAYERSVLLKVLFATRSAIEESASLLVEENQRDW